MINQITRAAVRQPGIVLLAVLALLTAGVYKYKQMPVDAFPDVSPIMVPVFAEGHGSGPEEIERLITRPIETAMNGLPGVTQIKSTSAFGMAVVYVYFSDDTDMYFARRLVSEKISAVQQELPEMHTPPKLGPISTGLGQIFLYYLDVDPAKVDTKGKPVNTWLREINDIQVKQQLMRVEGVTEILAIGGHVLQYQIQVDPIAMLQYNLSFDDIINAVNANNRNVGGQFIVINSEEHLVRGVGRMESLDDLRNTPVSFPKGTPVLLSDVADVVYGNETRRGTVTLNGEREVVSGIVLKLFEENTSKVIERLYMAVEKVQKSLPDGVTIVPYYEQAELVKNATWTVKKSLLIGAILVVLTLTIFLGNLRAAAIVAMALPVCALFAVICMSSLNISANLMSLGGIAVAIGMLSDGAIVMMENIFRHLNDPERQHKDKALVILDAAKEVSRPITFSVLVIVSVFLPLFSLQGVEGKMFQPMAITTIFALIGSLAAAIIIVPVLSLYIVRQKKHTEPPVVRFISRIYRPLLKSALKRKVLVITGAAMLFLLSLLSLPLLGTQFVPTLEEGSMMIGVTMSPAISLEKAKELVMGMEKEIIKFEPVKKVVSRTGRPEAGSHPHPVNYAEIHIELEPFGEWKQFRNKNELRNAIEEKLSLFPGVQLNFTQPIQNSFDELLSGTRAQLAIKVFGDDLDIIRAKASLIEGAIENVEGITDLAVEQSFGQPQIRIVPDKDACARYEFSTDDVMKAVELAIGGETISEIYRNTRKYGIQIRLKKEFRSDRDDLGGIFVTNPAGAVKPLSQLTRIDSVTGPLQINRESGQRRWTVTCNIRDRDIGSVVTDIRTEIDKLDSIYRDGCSLEIGGQFENQQRAMKRLSFIVPIAIALVLIWLWMSFGKLRYAVVIFTMVPLSIIGGIAGLFITGQYLSVPASIGFIALFGIAMLDGVVLVTYINDLRKSGMTLSESVFEGSLMRVGPVMATTVTTLLGLLPLLLAGGIGADVQKPLAAVVVFGLLTSTVMTLFVIPSMYMIIEHYHEKKAASGEGEWDKLKHS